MAEYEAVIGLEVHAQLSTATKLFCGCPAVYGGEPNTRVCPVCLGLPGALPVVNRRAVEYAIRVGLAVDSAVAARSVFARKNYFYPDCPKNYQISQYDNPICSGGHVTIGDGAKRIGITRIHLEEDAGKLLHANDDFSHVDMNRSGVPLIEIVSRPDLRTPGEASEYLRKLRSIFRYLRVCDGNMEEGSIRCDANVSIREIGAERLGTKTEIKNVNSFKFVEQALAFEIKRQRGVLDAGGAVTHDTLLWDERRQIARVMRSKEEAHDYRYFPEPDLLALNTPESLVRDVADSMPELPDKKRRRFGEQYGLSTYDAGVLTGSCELADYFEVVAKETGDPKASSNWVTGEVLRELKERRIGADQNPVPPEALAELIGFQLSGRITTPTAKDVFEEMLASGNRAAAIVFEKNLEQITDDDTIVNTAGEILQCHPDAVAKYLGGNDRLLKFFVGQMMKETRGKADPQRAEEIIKYLLDKRRQRP